MLTSFRWHLGVLILFASGFLSLKIMYISVVSLSVCFAQGSWDGRHFFKTFQPTTKTQVGKDLLAAEFPEEPFFKKHGWTQINADIGILIRVD